MSELWNRPAWRRRGHTRHAALFRTLGRAAVLQDDPLTLAFWAFAIAVAALIPFRAINPSTRSEASVPDHPTDA